MRAQTIGANGCESLSSREDDGRAGRLSNVHKFSYPEQSEMHTFHGQLRNCNDQSLNWHVLPEVPATSTGRPQHAREDLARSHRTTLIPLSDLELKQPQMPSGVMMQQM